LKDFKIGKLKDWEGEKYEVKGCEVLRFKGSKVGRNQVK
jgi:hypothetical protein